MNTKNTNKKETILNLNDEKNKKAFLELKKESIKNESKIENLDLQNLRNKLANIKVKETNSTNNAKMYKFESLNLGEAKEKSLRSKYRKICNTFANNIIKYFQKENEIELKKEIKNFNKFYLETYILNDYSIVSIRRNNRDKDIELLLNSMLEIIKLYK